LHQVGDLFELYDDARNYKHYIYCIFVGSSDGLLKIAETCSRLFYIKIIVVFDVINYWFFAKITYRDESSKYEKRVEL